MAIFVHDQLEEIIETVLYSARIKDSVPVSILLIAKSGTAKSALIKQYQGPNIHPCDSFSSQGMWDTAISDQKNEIAFMTVPDMNPTLSRKPSTVQSVIANLLTLLYDGSVRINDGRREKMCKHSPIGLISAVTPEIYRANAKRWLWLGIRRRIIPLFFEYSNETIRLLQGHVRKGKIHSALNGKKTIVLPKPYTCAIDERHGVFLEAESTAFSVTLGKNGTWDKSNSKMAWIDSGLVPVSPHLTLRSLAQAHARRDNRAKVNDSDIDFICRFRDFSDPENPKKI